MIEEPREYEVIWLKELERRIAEDQPLDVREMLVALRDKLPLGFKPSDVQPGLLYGSGPSLEGLKAIGDHTRILPDVERAIRYIRERLIDNPALTKVAATDLAGALDVALKRAERLLGLVSSLGLATSGSGSPYGMSEIGLGREEVVAEYMGFQGLAALMDKRAGSSAPSVSAPPSIGELADYRLLIEKADAAYRPFPPFSEWVDLRVNQALWQNHLDSLQDLGSDSTERLRRAREVAKRSAAIETGAIEGLYELDRGRTITIALQSAMWEAALAQEDARVRALIECQLEAYDFVLDFATQAVPIAAAWIRELHKRLCSAQATYRALTAIGPQDQPLAHGEYKSHPNHVRLEDGSLYSYSPVLDTPAEMDRLVKELSSEDFKRAHPVLQASYAHYAFVRVHPFQDGNGRVARAIGSVFTYRSASVPLLVLVAHREAYLAALRSADSGDYQAFVTFVYERGLDAFLLVSESLQAADVPDPLTQIEAISAGYVTRGGYTHHQVDLAGQTLLRAVHEELQRQSKDLAVPNAITFRFDVHPGNYPSPLEGYRGPVAIQVETVRVILNAAGPASAEVIRQYYYNLPRNCGLDDPIIIRCMENNQELRTPVSRILVPQRAVMDLQVAMFVQRALGNALAQLRAQSAEELRRQGY